MDQQIFLIFFFFLLAAQGSSHLPRAEGCAGSQCQLSVSCSLALASPLPGCSVCCVRHVLCVCVYSFTWASFLENQNHFVTSVPAAHISPEPVQVHIHISVLNKTHPNKAPIFFNAQAVLLPPLILNIQVVPNLSPFFRSLKLFCIGVAGDCKSTFLLHSPHLPTFADFKCLFY